jgi:enoyl-CoA hydratase/carnithine racemase
VAPRIDKRGRPEAHDWGLVNHVAADEGVVNDVDRSTIAQNARSPFARLAFAARSSAKSAHAFNLLIDAHAQVNERALLCAQYR